MSDASDYTNFDATDLSDLLASGDVTPAELVTAASERIDTWNPRINAICHYDGEQALKQAHDEGLSETRLKGVPFLVKDLVTEVQGFPYTCGSRVLAAYVAEEDCELVKRYRHTGYNVVGSTNTAEFGLLPVTESELSGATRNPWNTDCNTGGSSGGAAAAVACGIVPVAGATDGGGSIRIPAAFTGTFGFKPSRGVIPQDPMGEPWDGAAVSHVITRTVRDSFLALQNTAGLTGSAPYAAIRSIGEPARKDFEEPRKVGVCFRSPLTAPVSDNNRQALQKAAKALEARGFIVEEIDSLFDGYHLLDGFLPVLFGQVSADLETLSARLGKTIRRKDVEPATWLLAQMGKHVSARDFALAKQRWAEYRLLMATYFCQYDFILTPVTAIDAPLNGQMLPDSMELNTMKFVSVLKLERYLPDNKQFKENFYQSFEGFPFTLIANITGIPAFSAPVWLEGRDMPSAVQVMGPVGSDAELMELAFILEQELPWFQHYKKLN